MARKRKEKSEEEDVGFKMPKFDEEKFLKREKRNIKTLYISFLFALLISLISFGLWVLMIDSAFRWELAMLFGVINMVWIRYLFEKLNIDLTDFGRKGWFGSFAVYLFTWLLVFVVLINPPIYDGEAPVVEIVALPEMQEPGGTVQIAAQIIDNVGIEKEDIEFILIDPDGNQSSPPFSFENRIFYYIFENQNRVRGEYQFQVTATDVNGHSTYAGGSFSYNENVIVLISPEENTSLRSYTPIEFRVDEGVFTSKTAFPVQDTVYTMDFLLYYQLNNGEKINVSRLDPNKRDVYRTTAEYNGWIKDTNITITPIVEVAHYFINNDQRFSNTVEDTTSYEFTALDDADIGRKDRLIPPLPQYKLNDDNQPANILNYYVVHYRPTSATPGFEIAIFLASLLIVLILIKKRKSNTKK